MTEELSFHPVTPDRLEDLARFSATHGKFGYCSCMRWRLRSSEFQRSTKETRAATLTGLVSEATPVGVLAYLRSEPVGWCSVAPRETYGALERSRTLQRIDDEPVWSVVCFFVDRRVRRRRVTVALLNAAVDYAVSSGARIVEGYPVEPGHTYGYMGSPRTFLEAGFRDVTPPGRARQVMRYQAS
jgi:GNAT superfamily N-acetyltransferase